MKSIKAIAFDMYGTLFDVNSVETRCDEFFPGHGKEISVLWRRKNLEYSWLRSLMGDYVPFEKVVEDALKFACTQLNLSLEKNARTALCEEYLKLRPHPEVPAALEELQSMGIVLSILSNGTAHAIQSVVRNSGLEKRFTHLLSTDPVQVCKPHHDAYELGEKRLGLERREILFVSSSPWDASGARHFGYPVCWVNRPGPVFDEIGQLPDYVISGIDELPGCIRRFR